MEVSVMIAIHKVDLPMLNHQLVMHLLISFTTMMAYLQTSVIQAVMLHQIQDLVVSLKLQPILNGALKLLKTLAGSKLLHSEMLVKCNVSCTTEQCLLWKKLHTSTTPVMCLEQDGTAYLGQHLNILSTWISMV